MSLRVLLFLAACFAPACGRPSPATPSACPSGTTWAESCTSCGPTDACLELVSGCFETCSSGACDGGVPCVGGACRNVCG